MIKDITQLGQPADVLGVADYSLIPKLMSDPSKPHASWYVGFVSNQITFAYTSHSKGASQLTASNWYKVLAEPGVHIGRSNPAADPSGYQILQMLQLAQGYYHDPGLSAAVLKNSPDSSVAETETSLLAALQSGQIDYLAIYRSDALEQHLKYIALPAQINLSDSGDGRRLRQGHHPRRLARRADRQAHHLRADHPQHRAGRGTGPEVHQLRAQPAGPGHHEQQRVRGHLTRAGQRPGQPPGLAAVPHHAVARRRWLTRP